MATQVFIWENDHAPSQIHLFLKRWIITQKNPTPRTKAIFSKEKPLSFMRATYFIVSVSKAALQPLRRKYNYLVASESGSDQECSLLLAFRNLLILVGLTYILIPILAVGGRKLHATNKLRKDLRLHRNKLFKIAVFWNLYFRPYEKIPNLEALWVPGKTII